MGGAQRGSEAHRHLLLDVMKFTKAKQKISMCSVGPKGTIHTLPKTKQIFSKTLRTSRAKGSPILFFSKIALAILGSLKFNLSIGVTLTM